MYTFSRYQNSIKKRRLITISATNSHHRKWETLGWSCHTSQPSTDIEKCVTFIVANCTLCYFYIAKFFCTHTHKHTFSYLYTWIISLSLSELTCGAAGVVLRTGVWERDAPILIRLNHHTPPSTTTLTHLLFGYTISVSISISRHIHTQTSMLRDTHTQCHSRVSHI